MTTYEILKDNLKVPIKELAGDLHLSKESIHKWISGEQRNPLDRLFIILDNSDKGAVLDYICHRSGGYYIELPKSEETSSEICANACKEFGELLTAMSLALSDGVVDEIEYDRINKEWGDLQNVMHGFLREQKKLIGKRL